MMLLQAGQAGLYRRDSIWTEEIPPEMVAGCTLWVDATDKPTLFKGVAFNLGNPVHGDEVWSAMNKIAPANGLVQQYGSAPKLKDPAVNSKSALSIATAAGTGMAYTANVATTPSNLPMSSLVTTTTKLIIAVLKVAAAAPYSGVVYNDNAIFMDGSQYVGLHVTDDAGVLTVRAYNYAGGIAEATRTIARDAWQVVTMSHQGSQLRCRVNGGAWATTASGATDVLTGDALFLRTAATAVNIEMPHIATFNTTQTDAAISAVERWAANDVGITPWW